MPTTKRLRLSIDFTVEIADEPPLLPDGIVEPPDPEYDGRQARLLEAMKSNPDALRNWLKWMVATEMTKHSSFAWDSLIMGAEANEQMVIDQVIASLSDEDQSYFEDMKRMDLVYESSDMFRASFTVAEAQPLIEELSK